MKIKISKEKFIDRKNCFAAFILRIFPRSLGGRKPKAPVGFRGQPVTVEKFCIGCGACSHTCPTGAIVIEDKGETRKIIRRYNQCIFCGECERRCPQPISGVRLSREHELAGGNKGVMQSSQEFSLIRCTRCGYPIGTLKALQATSTRVGPALASVAPELILSDSVGSGIPVPPSKKRKEITRSDIMSFLCSDCRHRVYVKDSEM
ncbi:MAG: 4Fe-4S binding protein [Elusimicrobia bacterium]|nr:4Fe-4S binding protein [Elusimicrobiota bacterium]